MRDRLKIVLALMLAAASARAAATEFDKGLQLKKDGKFAPAAKVFTEILAKKPRNLAALEQSATLQGWLGDYPASIATWTLALEIAPTNRDFRLGLARVLYWNRDYKPSLTELETVLKSEPKSVDAWTLLGDVYAASSRLQEAHKAYLKAQELAPDDAALAKKAARTEAAKP